jgi:hypothetical protein
MGRVAIRCAVEAPIMPLVLPGFTTSEDVATRAVVHGEKRPILLWTHEMQPNAELRWDKPAMGQVAYVWEGSILAGEGELQAGSAILVEHGGAATVRGGANGATMLHFHRPQGHPQPPPGSGGGVHILGPEGAYQSHDGPVATNTIYGDSACPTCELWLHKTAVSAGGLMAPRHYHTDDEIIFILSGAMIVGSRELGPGTALAIDSNTIYSFKTGPEGLEFINFRPTHPFMIKVDPPGEGKPISERDHVLATRDPANAHAP